MKIKVITVGGTIDKEYFDAKSHYQVGNSNIGRLLKEVNVTFDYDIHPLMQKDSLEMTDDDRLLISQVIRQTDAHKILITHGTDTMVDTAKVLSPITDKTIVLTGAMQPLLFRDSDAIFNIAFALGTLSTQQNGVYIAMNGRIFTPDNVIKNRDHMAFEHLN